VNTHHHSRDSPSQIVQTSPSKSVNPLTIVGYYRTGSEGFREEQVYQMPDFSQAEDAYKSRLQELIST
jgi:hypothetical protein